MKTLKALLLTVMIGTALLSTGCATTSGTAAIANPDTVAAIQVGKSTMKDVLALLGQPMDKDLGNDNGELWLYSFTQVSGINYIPVVSLFGGNVTADTLKIAFNKKGIVTKVLKPAQLKQ